MFITLEGGEGVGKTTQIAAIRQWLEARGHKVVTTREPGGTPLAEALRNVVVSAEQTVPPLSELLLMFAARVSHVNEVIAPALEAGKTVLCDRFTDASYAYQGGGRGLPASQIEMLESWLPAKLQPDLTILIDVPVEVGLARAHQRGQVDRFEVEAEAFFHRVREAYMARAKRFPQRFMIIAADDHPPERVSEKILSQLGERLDQASHE